MPCNRFCADHAGLVGDGVVQRDGADVAPVPVQVALPAGRAGAAQLEQPGGGLGCDVVEVHLDLGDLQLRLGRQLRRRVPVDRYPRRWPARSPRRRRAPRPWRCRRCWPARRVDAAAAGRRWAVSVGAWLKLRSRDRSSATPSSTTAARTPATTAWMYSCSDAYCTVGVGLGVVGRVGQHLVGGHGDVGEGRGAGAGAALTEAVPVVDESARPSRSAGTTTVATESWSVVAVAVR